MRVKHFNGGLNCVKREKIIRITANLDENAKNVNAERESCFGVTMLQQKLTSTGKLAFP